MIIASRTLKLEAEGTITDISVRLFAPVLEATHTWKCDYEIA